MSLQKQIKEMEAKTKHCVFGPSSLPRIILCPGSVREAFLAQIPDESIYAARGTMQHEAVVETYTKGQGWLASYDKLTAVEKNNVLDCLEYLQNEVLIHYPTDGRVVVELEVEVNLSSWGLDEVYGTSDVIVSHPDVDRVDVIDWKFGSGVQVYADKNPQAIAYGAGSVGFPNPTINNVHLHIVQPPLNHYDEYVMSYDDMSQFVFNEIEPAILSAKSKEAPFNPGEKQCKFCNAGMTCRARHDHQVNNAAKIFHAHSKINQVSKEELSNAMVCAEEYESYIKAIRVYANSELMHGRSFPDFKLVSGRSTRKFKDEKKAFEYLREVYSIENSKLYTAKPIGPAGAEKLDRGIKKDPIWRELIDKPPGKPIMVSEDDPREAVTPTSNAANVFSDEV